MPNATTSKMSQMELGTNADDTLMSSAMGLLGLPSPSSRENGIGSYRSIVSTKNRSRHLRFARLYHSKVVEPRKA